MSMLIILILQVAESIRFLKRGIADLDKLLLSLLNEDFALSFPENQAKNRMKELHKSLNKIIRKFKDLKIEKENHFRLLETIIECLNVGIMAIGDHGKVILMNSALREQLRLPPISDRAILKKRIPNLLDRIEGISMGQQVLLDWKTENGTENLACYRGKMNLHAERLNFYTVQNIRREMEKREIESYQQLIRILTHEIMKSVTPIGSLSDSMLKLIQTERNGNTNSELFEDLELGLDTINRRTSGLYRFVQDYRKMSQVPDPVLKEADLTLLVQRLATLYKKTFEEKKISLVLEISKQNHICNFDEELLEQAWVNLLKNTIETVDDQDDKKIIIRLENDLGRHKFSIIDNGPGIPADKQDRIFVPFYSTKKSGSGIGLSLSNYIVNKHKSKLNFTTSSEGTNFWFEL